MLLGEDLQRFDERSGAGAACPRHEPSRVGGVPRRQITVVLHQQVVRPGLGEGPVEHLGVAGGRDRPGGASVASHLVVAPVHQRAVHRTARVVGVATARRGVRDRELERLSSLGDVERQVVDVVVA